MVDAMRIGAKPTLYTPVLPRIHILRQETKPARPTLLKMPPFSDHPSPFLLACPRPAIFFFSSAQQRTFSDRTAMFHVKHLRCQTAPWGRHMTTPELFDTLNTLTTEQRNPYSMHIDTASVLEILEVMNTEDHRVPIAVRREIPYIAQAVDLIVAGFQQGGRLIYLGAGTSGRLGILDASECPPTFGTPPSLIQGLIAGGLEAVFQAQEGAEDHESYGIADLKQIDLSPKDVVCGIAASRRTPYVVGGIGYARSIGCKTLFITCNPRTQFDVPVDVAMCPTVGPEILMGSTRMKSGTAQKLVLNMLTTASMIRLGKVYENMMVDLQLNSAKLVERARRVVMTVTGLPYPEAALTLDRADGHVKSALVMELAGVDLEEAKRRLKAHNGFVRAALEIGGEGG